MDLYPFLTCTPERALPQENNNINTETPTQKRISGSKKHLGKVHLGSIRKKRIILSITPLTEHYPLSLFLSLFKAEQIPFLG